MASPSASRASDAMPLAAARQSPSDDSGHASSIPRRLMRVKVLYTFDDQNKSNCLARLPSALEIPSVALDETTEIGVIELKSCIKAIVAASPELVAKLGHDYTVYAYDYSEYETPLVGQGMLSWILASASATPSAPAEQSQTMVTGRVCKNILGLFSNGIKETLEVKLKLVPVPTCMQHEYVQNMERYHNLSQLMPEGLDYSAWADFLKANPGIEQFATSRSPSNPPIQPHYGRTEPYPDQVMQFTNHNQRCPSPAMSTASYQSQHPRSDSTHMMPSSIPNDLVPYYQADLPPAAIHSQQDDGPPKKRVRVSKASRPKRTAINTKNESLRVTASTAASVRLHRPSNATADIVALDQPPRVPTPRPGEKAFPPPPSSLRPPAPSLLRHTSTEEQRPSYASFESAMFSDAAMESADDDRGPSPGETGDTPLDIPSSPPVMSARLPSSAPSSPGLPTLPALPDSGFVSDLRDGLDQHAELPQKARDQSTISDVKTRSVHGKSWKEVAPGPLELLPKTYVPKPKTYGGRRMNDVNAAASQPAGMEQAAGPGNNVQSSIEVPAGPPTAHPGLHRGHTLACDEPYLAASPFALNNIHGRDETADHNGQQTRATITGSSNAQPDVIFDHSQPSSRSQTPNLPNKRPTASKSRGLPRSHTWSGEPMSDAPGALDDSSAAPRSGSGAKRRKMISERLRDCIAAGEMPPYCSHCGEIETPTWRKAYMRVEEGLPINIELTSTGTGITAFEIVEPTDEDESPRYRIFKQALTKEEEQEGSFETLTLCNPCGLWLRKQNALRPGHLWIKKNDPSNPKPKRKRAPAKGPRKRAKAGDDDLMSDAIVPHSEPIMQPSQGGPANHLDVTAEEQSHSGTLDQTQRFESHSTSQDLLKENSTAMAALYRAIQSSPVGMRSHKEQAMVTDPDLTPKPTRRLLFPSPRRAGETKSLNDSCSSTPTAKKITSGQPDLVTLALTFDAHEIDKENCPPAGLEDEDFSHLFEEVRSAKTTPTKKAPFHDLLKTPTPGSRQRAALTPKANEETRPELTFMSPSRIILTPGRGGRAPTVAPETPFTRQLNALLSDCISSPSQNLDLSAFPIFNLSPNRFANAPLPDFPDDFLSSDLPMPSSPPGLGFSLYEDPATSTVGLWSGASIFDNNDHVRADGQHKLASPKQNTTPGPVQTSIDLSAMFNGVVRTEHGRTPTKDETKKDRDNVGTDLQQSAMLVNTSRAGCEDSAPGHDSQKMHAVCSQDISQAENAASGSASVEAE